MDREQEREGGKRDKKRVYSINLPHTRTALCGGFQGKREKEAGCGGLETDSRRRNSQRKKTNMRGKGKDCILIYCDRVLVICEKQKT